MFTTDDIGDGLGGSIATGDIDGDGLQDIVLSAPGAGTDTIQSALLSFDLATLPNVENLTAIGAAAAATLTGAGNALDNVITGGAGDDVLTGLDGDDGVDELRIELSGLQTITFGADIENAVVISGTTIVNGNDGANDISATTTSGVVLNGLLGDDTLTGGIGNDQLNGREGADAIDGGAGDDVIDGGVGADAMIGGSGDDAFTVDDAGDTVTEAAAAGTDTITSSIDLALPDNVENLTLTGAALNGAGNGLDNTIRGTAGNNILDGQGGDDTLIGLAGDDTYIFDTEDDVAVEAVNEGTDNVQSTATMASLGLNIENLTLLGGADINGGGNNLANIITGNIGANTLQGFGGDDRLDGGAGADFMSGGLGDDLFIVDNVADLVTELAGQGTDTVQASVSFNLSLNVDNLVLVGGGLNGGGNLGANQITGNGNNNTITGEGGDDVLSGGAGDTVTELEGEQGVDRVVIEFGGGFNLFAMDAGLENADVEIGTGAVRGNGLDNNIEVTTGFALIADGAAGNDGIIGSINNDRILGGSGEDALTGGDGSDRIFGQAGDDVIRGGEGDHVMTGQSNADRCEFFALSGLDLITDFDVSEDVIALNRDSTGINDFATLQFQISDNVDGNAEVEISAGTDIITLTGVTTAQLSSANFDFF